MVRHCTLHARTLNLRSNNANRRYNKREITLQSYLTGETTKPVDLSDHHTLYYFVRARFPSFLFLVLLIPRSRPQHHEWRFIFESPSVIRDCAV